MSLQEVHIESRFMETVELLHWQHASSSLASLNSLSTTPLQHFYQVVEAYSSKFEHSELVV